MNLIPRYLDDHLHFESMEGLSKDNASDTDVSVLDLHLSKLNGLVLSKIYDKRVDFDLCFTSFFLFHGDVPSFTSNGDLHLSAYSIGWSVYSCE